MTNKLDRPTGSVGDKARNRAYLRDFWPGIAAYSVVFIGVLVWGHLDGSSTWRFVWALLPVIPMAWVVRAVVRHVHRIDDYQRRLLLQGLSVGFGVAMITALAVGFLAVAGLAPRGGGFIIYGAGDGGLGGGGVRFRPPGMRNHLRALREDRGWTQGALADRLDVSRQTVNALETGRFDPSLPLAFRLARLFDRPIEAIFEPELEPDPAGRSDSPDPATSRRRAAGFTP